MLGAEEHSGQVDSAEPMPFLEARLLDAFAEKKPGIVDEDVEPAKPGHRRRDRRCPVLLAGHVEMVVGGGPAGAGDALRGLPSALVQHVADRHLGAGFDHQPRGRGTNAARRAGDKGDLAVETVHFIAPRSRSSLAASLGYDAAPSAEKDRKYEYRAPRSPGPDRRRHYEHLRVLHPGAGDGGRHVWRRAHRTALWPAEDQPAS